jgi:hypothetical protein
MSLVWVILSATACTGKWTVDFQPAPFVRSGALVREDFQTAALPNVALLFVEIFAGDTVGVGQISEAEKRNSAHRTTGGRFQQTGHAQSLSAWSMKTRIAPVTVTIVRTTPVMTPYQNMAHSVSPLPRVDLDRGVSVMRTRGHLDDVQLLAAMTDDQGFRAVAAVDHSSEAGIQFVDGGLVQGVNVHKWSEPDLSFVPSPKGSRTGPDTADVGGACTRSRRVVKSVHSGGQIRTAGLQVMSLTSYHCSTPHEYFVSHDWDAVNLSFSKGLSACPS